MATAAIETVGLRKRYDRLPVLDGLTLRVEHGEVFCLLGPNGVGKSTLLHLLLGFLRPNAGDVRVLGEAPGHARRVGYLPERVRYHRHFAPREYLRHLGRFSDLAGPALDGRIEEVLAIVDLARVADRRLGTFSKGMLQRLGLAQALLSQPDLLLIDEPTSGLDPAGQREVLDLLLTLRLRGHTILACTHQLAEVELLADRVGVLWNGRLAALASVADLRTTSGVTIQVGSRALTPDDAASLAALGSTVTVDGRAIQVVGDPALQRRVLQRLLDLDLTVAELRPFQSGIETFYLEAIRGQATDSQASSVVGAGVRS